MGVGTFLCSSSREAEPAQQVNDGHHHQPLICGKENDHGPALGRSWATTRTGLDRIGDNNQSVPVVHHNNDTAVTRFFWLHLETRCESSESLDKSSWSSARPGDGQE
jgi:hypothetical protein